MNCIRSVFVFLIIFVLIAFPNSVQSCAVCFGAPDDPMTKGMQWGIASLLFILIPVLGSVGSFFVFIFRRNKEYAAFRDPELFKE